MGWDTFRIPSLDYLHKLFGEILEKGSVDRITMSDTFGMAHPSAVSFVFRKLQSFFPGVPLGFHIHNDFGMATASALVALTSGASSVHSTVNGLGERAGNVATEEVAVGLQHLLGVDAGIKLDRLNRVSRVFAETSKRPMPPNKPIVGSALFEVESGIVVHILRQMRATNLGEVAFSPYPPEKVGQTPYEVIPGRGTGHHAVRELLERMHLAATDEQVAEIVERVKQVSLVLKNALPEPMFGNIVLEVLERSQGNRTEPVVRAAL
jgi:isopropylmalate/homocitrate/citramalate synthase